MKIETGEADPDHSLTFKDIKAQAIMICMETTLDYNTGIDAAITEAPHDNLTQLTEDAATHLTMIHHTNHITDHPNIETLCVIDPRIVVGHVHTPLTDLQGMNLADQIHALAG